MARYVGVDWASGCWVVVALDEDPLVSTEPAMLNVWNRFDDAEAILVDIPIGLAERGRRRCDERARERIEGRHSTVFSVPTAGAVACRDYDEARRANVDAGFGGLGSQSWGLVPRIREVGVLLDEIPEAVDTIHESHPEVCFAALQDGDEDLPSKTTDEGRCRRLEILRTVDRDFGEAVTSFVDDRIREPRWHQKIQSGRADDVVDAAALALTAKLAADRDYPTLPEEGSVDDPPVIVHPGG